jgi:hypothetical protein
VRVDRTNFGVQTWQMPDGGYGMAVDRNDRVWTCSRQVGRFDYPTQTWQTANAGGSGGCMPDGGDLLWLANDPMVAVDINTMAWCRPSPCRTTCTASASTSTATCGARRSTTTRRTGWTRRPADRHVTGLNYPYTYSDMTGFGLSQLGGPSG